MIHFTLYTAVVAQRIHVTGQTFLDIIHHVLTEIINGKCI